MKKNLLYQIHSFLLLCIVAGIMLLPACRKDQAGQPSISHLRNYAASPNDTILETVSAGQWVVVVGNNLSSVSQAYFGTTAASINSTFFSDTCCVIQIPAIPFPLVPRDKLNEISLVSEGGTATFKVNITGEPIISNVRNAAAAPNNAIVNSILPGQLINIVGYNLKEATKIAFQGIAADLTKVTYSDSSAIVQVPANLSGGDASQVNMISYTTKIGVGTFAIKIIGPPVITSISSEIPKAGDEVNIYGNNFGGIQSLTFAGETISTYKVAVDENSVNFIAPALTQSGPVVITTPGGTFTSAYKVNDINFINGGGVGIIANMEWSDYFGWAWWGGGILNSSDPNSGWPSYNADFGVGTGMYIELKSNILNGGAGDDGNAIRINDAKSGWVPTENLSDPGSNWALKFEINVAKPWKGGTICIKSTNGNYIARYEPWQISSSKTIAYTTKGWQTVTIPLSEFRLTDGKGASITKVSDLLDPTSGNGNLTVYLHNYNTSATETTFDGAFDNFRVVKR